MKPRVNGRSENEVPVKTIRESVEEIIIRLSHENGTFENLRYIMYRGESYEELLRASGYRCFHCNAKIDFQAKECTTCGAGKPGRKPFTLCHDINTPSTGLVNE
jgi:hypothetical protein